MQQYQSATVRKPCTHVMGRCAEGSQWAPTQPRKRKLSKTVLFLAGALLFETSLAQPCSGVCPDGSPVGEPEKLIDLPQPYSFVKTCGALDTLLPSVLEEASDECQLIQQVSTYCGCRVPEGACQLCPANDGGGGGLDNEQLVVEDFPPIQTDLITTTCGIVQAYLHSLNETHSS